MYRFGIVGCGRFIGDMHIKGALFDHRATLTCGAFSRDPAVSARKAEKYNVTKIYCDYREMCNEEAARQSLDFVIIATPNASHYEIAKAFLEAGIPVMCDKPVAVTLEQAKELEQIAALKHLHFGVSYTYFGYPMLTEAKMLIAEGALGELMDVQALMMQDSRLAELLDGSIYQNNWKQDSSIVGKSSTLFDIGVHLEYIIRYVTGLRNESLLAVLQHKPNNPPLDTGASVLLQMSNGVNANYALSQVAAGACNDMHIEIYGTKGSLIWDARDFNALILRQSGKPEARLIANRPYTHAESRRMLRMPNGIYEGSYEAFANIYNAFFDAMDGKCSYYPSVSDGVKGVAFVEACRKSMEQDCGWVKL